MPRPIRGRARSERLVPGRHEFRLVLGLLLAAGLGAIIAGEIGLGLILLLHVLAICLAIIPTSQQGSPSQAKSVHFEDPHA